MCRIRFDYSECLVGATNTQVLEHAVGELAKRYEMDWRIYYDSKVKRVAILVSKLDHCLYDLLIRLKAGELSCQVPVIISNHPDLAPIAQQFGVAFRSALYTTIGRLCKQGFHLLPVHACYLFDTAVHQLLLSCRQDLSQWFPVLACWSRCRDTAVLLYCSNMQAWHLQLTLCADSYGCTVILLRHARLAAGTGN